MTYRVGIVGSGFGGAVHAPAFSLHPQFELLAIASPHRAAAVAAERAIPHAFPSLGAMLDALGDELDVISIATPPYLHHDDLLAAVAAGKHVLCEKPLATRLADAEAMAAAIERAGVRSAVVFEHRYHSAPQALRELVVNGHLSPLREIEIARFGTEQRADHRRPNSWWFDFQRGGGLANAFMPHLIDLACYVTGGTIEHASGFLRTANPERLDPQGNRFTSTVADGVFAVADLGHGIAARLTLDSTLALNQMTIAVHGEGRSAVATGVMWNDMSLYVLEEKAESSEYELKPNPYAKYGTAHPSVPAFLSLLDDFAVRLATGGGPAPTFADGLATQRVMQAIGYEVPR
jgi:predicted dehydrogenase